MNSVYIDRVTMGTCCESSLLKCIQQSLLWYQCQKKSILRHKINKWRRWVGYVFTSGLFCYEAQTTTTTICHSYAEKTWNVATHTEELIYWSITLRNMKYIPCSFVILLLRLRCHNHIICFSVHLCRLWFYLLFRTFIIPESLRAQCQMMYHLCCLSKQFAVYSTPT